MLNGHNNQKVVIDFVRNVHVRHPRTIQVNCYRYVIVVFTFTTTMTVLMITLPLQLEEPTVHYTFCPGCQNEPLKEVKSRKDIDEYLRHMKWTKHERFKGQFTCLTCGKAFVNRQDLVNHPCSRTIDDGQDFARYTMIEPNSVTYNILKQLSPAALYQQCFEEQKVVPNLYPCNIYFTWQQKGC